MPKQEYTRSGGAYLGISAQSSSRLPAGHPEAFYEAFANIYTSVFDAMAEFRDTKE